jgi:hypothetical protein
MIRCRGRAQLPSVTAYENRIRNLEERKIELNEKIASRGRPHRTFDETLELLKLAFADRLAYARNEGFRTPDLALPFKVLADLKSSKSKLARPEGQTSNSLLDTLAEWNLYLQQGTRRFIDHQHYECQGLFYREARRRYGPIADVMSAGAAANMSPPTYSKRIVRISGLVSAAESVGAGNPSGRVETGRMTAVWLDRGRHPG